MSAAARWAGLVLLLALAGQAAAGAYGIDLQGGLSVPLSPEGPNSFSQSYGSCLEPGAVLWAQLWDDWRVGVAGRTASYAHKAVAGTSLGLWLAELQVEWDGPTEESGWKDHFLLRAGLGAGGASLSTPALYQSRSWASVAGSLGAGWEVPLHPAASLMAGTDISMVAGPGKADPIVMGSVSLGLRFQLTDAWMHQMGWL